MQPLSDSEESETFEVALTLWEMVNYNLPTKPKFKVKVTIFKIQNQKPVQTIKDTMIGFKN